ncbi:hypothetical protein GGQ68_004462 [Sagittula marina]|uniref:Uncharacterized protein n=1 Tax=Sagittula marina TaxID=943940 RepID=A0A7W6DUN9_9RHOB|nr:hypothetical protein [Sagittula marina]MBB3988106.1 hypothetical protein [Sagittula marina]
MTELKTAITDGIATLKGDTPQVDGISTAVRQALWQAAVDVLA